MLMLMKEDMPYGFRTKRERVRMGGFQIFCAHDILPSGWSLEWTSSKLLQI